MTGFTRHTVSPMTVLVRLKSRIAGGKKVNEPATAAVREGVDFLHRKVNLLYCRCRARKNHLLEISFSSKTVQMASHLAPLKDVLK